MTAIEIFDLKCGKVLLRVTNKT